MNDRYVLKVMYHSDIDSLEQVEGSDWIDCRAAEDVSMKAGEFKLISLGFSCKLPFNHEGHLVPRSSTFKKYGVLMANSVGIIDETFAGEDDIWMFAAYATRDTFIPKNTRFCQFRIFEKQPELKIKTVDHLDDESRGGFGSTGVQ